MNPTQIQLKATLRIHRQIFQKGNKIHKSIFFPRIDPNEQEQRETTNLETPRIFQQKSDLCCLVREASSEESQEIENSEEQHKF